MSRDQVETVKDMTLRDWFAGAIEVQKIDVGSIGNGNKIAGFDCPDSDNLEGQIRWQCAIESKVRYMKADAMLKAREVAT